MKTKDIKIFQDKLKNSYVLNKSIEDIIMPIPTTGRFKIISQLIDSYGKTRRLNIEFKKHIICLITNPIQPINIIETTSKLITKTPLNIAMIFIKELNIELKYQTTVDKKTIELNGILGNVQVSIPIEETNILDNIPEQKDNQSFTINSQSSILEQYNKNKKLARYLMEYTIWMYSKYLNKDTHTHGVKTLGIFAKTLFKIDPKFKYGYVSKAFKVDNSSLGKNNLIIVHNLDTLKRLIYFLKLCCQRNLGDVLNYHKRVFIQNYYVDITDFTQHPNQVILFGEESIEHWISENNLKYTLHSGIQIGNNLPYFFKNDLIDKKNIYLAQNTSSLEKALDIAITWIKKGYNKGIFAKPRKIVSFTLYSYINAHNITKRNIISKPFTPGGIKIIGYKIENKPYYTTLLNLS